MKLKDFDFRIVKKGIKPFIQGKEAFLLIGELYGTDTEIELWSGSTDSGGVKIYEGDIVESLHDKKRYKVVNNGESFAMLRDKWFYDFSSMLFEEGVKVIGNIHENADLLE